MREPYRTQLLSDWTAVLFHQIAPFGVALCSTFVQKEVSVFLAVAGLWFLFELRVIRYVLVMLIVSLYGNTLEKTGRWSV